MALVHGGAAAYYFLGHGRWSFHECVYMTIITIFTVGYGELPDMQGVRYARDVTMFLIVGGVGALAYLQGNITALLVEGVLGEAFRRNRMRTTIQNLKGHVVVAGCGSTGRHVIEELVTTHTPFVVIDRTVEHLERISKDHCGGKMLYVHGDATEDQALLEAGIQRAKGIVAALTHDKDNLFVTLSARGLNPTARIVTKIVDGEAAPKMLKAGATAVVSPTMIGGHRMASEVIRPEVNVLLDQVLRDKQRDLSFEEVTIPDGSVLVGMALRDTPIRKETRLLVVAVRDADRTFIYNPEPDYVLQAGTTLIVMGETAGVVKLRQLVREGARKSMV